MRPTWQNGGPTTTWSSPPCRSPPPARTTRRCCGRRGRVICWDEALTCHPGRSEAEHRDPGVTALRRPLGPGSRQGASGMTRFRG
ncbi:hypothetical protein CSW58_07275 [Caulobacter sp. B11]|nr:hypothetical protein CSW58_07275 [Caulobacter sp. B11]